MVNTLTPAKKFEILQKHAKDFAAKKGSSRPVLEGVYFAPDGSAWVTDSHHALFIQGAHNYENPFISSVRNIKHITSNLSSSLIVILRVLFLRLIRFPFI